MNTYLYNGHVVTASNKDELLNPKKVVSKDREHLRELIKDAIGKYGTRCDLNFIDVSNVTDMHNLFKFSEFNGDISKWDVSNVTSMWGMFSFSKFNGDISKWDVSNVTDMSYMFRSSKFNGDISKWNVGNVTDMSYMFRNSKFNGDISKWNVSNVKDMTSIFFNSCFNYDGDISKWIPVMKKNDIDFKNLGLEVKENTWDDLEV